MTYSEEGLKLTKHFEGCRLKAYQDQGGVWTIGYGSTLGVKEGDTCTHEQAEAWICEDLADAVSHVNRIVKVPITQTQFDALVDFVFNLGFGSLIKSKLYRKLKAGDYEGAADEFPRWNHVNGKVIDGLTRRRLAERAMFMGQPWEELRGE
jgi:lysozyme